MAGAQYEADAARLKVYDISTGTTRTLAAEWDFAPSDLLCTGCMCASQLGHHVLPDISIPWEYLCHTTDSRALV